MEAPAGSISGVLGCPLATTFLPFPHETMFGQHPHNTVITHGKESTVTHGGTTVALGEMLGPIGRRSIELLETKRSSSSSSTDSEASTPAAVHSQNYIDEDSLRQQQQQQHLNGLIRTDKRPMEEDCWADLSAIGGTGTTATVVRDAFLGGFAPHTSPASPPSTTLAGSEFYETASGTNPILEDAFLSMTQNSLLDIRCGHFTTTAPSIDAAVSHHFRDAGSVGISPCSSSTQISSISSSDDSTTHPLQQHQLFPTHYALQQHPSSSSAFVSGIFHPAFYPLGPSLANVQQLHDDIGEGLISFDKMEEQHHLQLHPQPGELGHGQDEGDKESGDMKPPLFIMTELDKKQNQKQSHAEQQQQQQQHSLIGMAEHHQHHFDELEENGGDLLGSLSPPPPPLTPPSKTRSKMHDLALKYRLITSQNIRGQGSVLLSAEEKRTLIQEGFPIPTKLPLMREEEEALKIVRRKIKNKLSAQESRRKRKEYMDMLEKRVHAYFADNTQLRQKVRQLEVQNRFLSTQLQRVHGQNGDEQHQQQQQQQQQ
ncbi:hypothetical protein GPALN_001928 [Globodera pallida]|nr:hypothetical protein GPALN_001928 [Globodera pallida]